MININSVSQKTFWFDEWNVLDTAFMRRRENRWQIGSAWCFCRKTSFKSNMKLIYSILDANLSLSKWCWIHDFNCVIDGIQHITERETKNTFLLFCEGTLSCWRGIRVRKPFWFNELFIYYHIDELVALRRGTLT